MTKYVLTLALILSVGTIYAQDNSMRPAGQDAPEFNVAGNKVLIIPYEPRLYMSRIDGKIAQKTGLTMYQIKQRMRLGLNHKMFAEADKTHTPISLLDSEDPEAQQDLMYIYNSIGYKYEVMPVIDEDEADEPKTGVQKLAGLFTDRNGGDDVIETGNNNAPPRQEYQQEERYMNTTVINPNLFTYLAGRYEADMFVFINQLDITEEIKDAGYSYAKNANLRRLKVHYTVFTISGEQVYGGASIVYFPGKVNDLNGLINDYFPAAMENIAAHLPRPALSAEEMARKQQAEANATEQREVLGGY
jgi:hypothetical protein